MDALIAIVVLLSNLFVAFGTPCPTEDSQGCYWDAAAHGNGQGTSFVAVTDGAGEQIQINLP